MVRSVLVIKQGEAGMGMKTTAPMLARRYVGNQPCAPHRKNDAKLDELLPAPVVCPKSADFLVDHRHRSDTAIRSCRNWGGAIRSTHWCDSLHPLVRFAPPSPSKEVLVWATRTEQQATNLRTHADQVRYSRRPTSAPMLNRFYLFYISSFFYLPMGYPSRPHGRLGG